MRRAWSAFVVAAALLAPLPASAFCGFYVSGADTKLYADATQVVLMREGTKTVLSMQNDYKGPPEKFAVVIPVPVVLQKDQVKILPREVFDKVDKLGAPRLVEYWEQDPCAPSLGLGAIGTLGHGAGMGAIGTGAGGGADHGVKIEAQFAVGEYEIVILSAKDSGGLDAWLKEQKYAIPNGAEPYLRPYVEKGMKFFVAKVDVTKVAMKDGRATLSPIRFHYDDENFTLPVRLGLINSAGTQDLVVNILAKHERFEAANYPNVTIPTNLDVAESARGQFGQFYAALFDETVAKHPKAVVTEYAWDAGSCDPCPGPTLDPNDLATLGADVIPGGTSGLSGIAWGNSSARRAAPSLRQGVVTVDRGLPPEVVQRIVRQGFGRFRLCYENALRTNAKLAGTVNTSFTIAQNGEVTSAKDAGGDLKDDAMRSCVRKGIERLAFPEPDTKKPVKVAVEIVFAPPVDVADGGVVMRPTFMGSTPYVLTRLHVRYGKDSLGEDLVFREAKPLLGGRELRDDRGALEQGAVASTYSNNFQARYAIRHPWTGPIACKEPHRGIWGGPPVADGGDPLAGPTAPIAAPKTAYVPRGQVTLASFLSPEAIAAAEKATTPRPAATAGASSAAAASSSSSSDADAGAAPAKKRGCAGCALAPARTPWASSLAIGAGLAIAAIRRLRRRAAPVRSPS